MWYVRLKNVQWLCVYKYISFGAWKDKTLLINHLERQTGKPGYTFISKIIKIIRKDIQTRICKFQRVNKELK